MRKIKRPASIRQDRSDTPTDEKFIAASNRIRA
jgi:hypothetical protein